AVVLKAMALDPAQRYATAGDLACEVERWLADEPVAAHRESVVEGGLRWLRRHRPLVAGLTALLLTTLVGLAIGLYAVNQEKRTAEYNLELAREAVDKCFLVATEDPLLQQERMRKVRKLLLSQALPFYQSFLHQKPDDASISFEVANNYFRVARITEEIGSKEEALASYAMAYDAMTRVKRKPENDIYAANLARIANNRGVLLRDTGQWEQAQKSLEQARRLREEVLEKYPNSADSQSELASTCNNLGVLQLDR